MSKLKILFVLIIGFVIYKGFIAIKNFEIGVENRVAKISEITGLERSKDCLLYTSPSPRDRTRSRMPSSA